MRRILERETGAESARERGASPGDDEDFRRIIARLREVLQIRGS